MSVYNQRGHTILTNKKFNELVNSPDEKQKIKQFIDTIGDQNAGKNKPFEMEIYDPKNCGKRTFLLHKFYLKSSQEISDLKGQLTCLMGTDISDRIDYESRLTQSNIEVFFLHFSFFLLPKK